MSDFRKLVLYVFVAAFVLLALSFALGWIAWPFDLGSRANVEEQFRTGYELNESLQGTAQAVCTTEKAFNSETNANLKSQRQSQLLAYETNYARLSADYDAWSRNIFEGGIIRPADLPVRAPSLSEMKTQVCAP